MMERKELWGGAALAALVAFTLAVDLTDGRLDLSGSWAPSALEARR